jgi:N-acetylmuramoyl-L-alanine amidase
VPTKESALPVYNLNGTTYLSLVSLCDLRGINWEYDVFSKRITLSKDTHIINLLVGDNLVMVDGRAQMLKDPVDIYQGTVVVPHKFKEQVLDVLFKKSKAGARTVSPWSKIKRVVIDAGHGGNDPGALGRAGLREKVVTLDVAKRISSLLKSQGIDTVMTRSSDQYVSLERRVEIANNARVDLFLSIHANANRVRGLSGFEVYYISQDIDDAARAMSAAKDYALNMDNAVFGERTLNLKAILWDMVYTYNRAEAVELARSICRAMDRNLNMKILGIKAARFHVLKGVQIPAVLVEMGFLSNSAEERMLENGYYRQKIAESIAEGIKDYGYGLALALGE